MSIAEQAKAIYEAKLRGRLELEHPGEFVAIEPTSQEWFLAPTFIEAALAAKSAHPDVKSFVVRIGHEAAVHIGAATK